MTPVLIAALVVLAIGTLIVLTALVYWHRDTAVEFDLRYALIDGVTGRIAIEKVAFTGTFLLMGWGFVAQILEGKLSDNYTTIFAGTFAAARVLSQGISVVKDIKNVGTPAAPAGPNP